MLASPSEMVIIDPVIPEGTSDAQMRAKTLGDQLMSQIIFKLLFAHVIHVCIQGSDVHNVPSAKQSLLEDSAKQKSKNHIVVLVQRQLAGCSCTACCVLTALMHNHLGPFLPLV